MNLGDVKLGTKLTATTLIMAAVTICVGGVGWWSASSLEAAIDDIRLRSLVPAVELGRAGTAFEKARLGLLESVLAVTPEERRQHDAETKEAMDKAEASVTVFRETAVKPSVKERAARLADHLRAYRVSAGEIASVGAAGQRDRALVMRDGAARETAAAAVADLDALFKAKEEQVDVLHEESVRLGARVNATIAASCVLALAVALLLGRVLTRSIELPVVAVTRLAEKVAGGDLTVTVADHGRRDEIGDLNRSFGVMVENLRRLTSEVANGVAVLASSSTEILATTTELATAATETATAVTETTTTLEEVRQTAQLSSQRARAVTDVAQRASQGAEAGRAAVAETIAGMKRIRGQMGLVAESVVKLSEQSRAIGEITATVSDIADQSNLLAVNAAIEAAKAGEQGRSFGVVAQEIRSLAEQSKQATAQVRTILNDVQRAVSQAVMATEQGTKAVEGGAALADQSGQAIDLLATGSGEAAQAAMQISVSSQQQLAGMDQLSGAMESIKQASLQNAAGTKQTQRAADDLNQLGKSLRQALEKFRV